MANIQSQSVQLANPFPLSSSKPHLHKPFLLFTTRATDSDPSQPESEPPATTDDFDNRMSEFRLRYRSGTGKKAEVRKSRKSKKGASGSGSGSGSGVYLPPVPLKEPVSGGLKVELGFSQYSERLNGRIAILGVTALLLVELATGKGVINFALHRAGGLVIASPTTIDPATLAMIEETRREIQYLRQVVHQNHHPAL
ncbi:uncharacterized protein LOC133296233 [Gastrolobium bilobum]|uniref:uncharacterized protein LOC133296233 n=1 Tax=Gastrolobium bilobum TaxID=150636 RepID=UPI002AB026FF|nr:uncharacterized protein LOC133296233 [Gastrolobium bilobum]